jgi:hypothetical protein
MFINPCNWISLQIVRLKVVDKLVGT